MEYTPETLSMLPGATEPLFWPRNRYEIATIFPLLVFCSFDCDSLWDKLTPVNISVHSSIVAFSEIHSALPWTTMDAAGPERADMNDVSVSLCLSLSLSLGRRWTLLDPSVQI